MSKKVVVTFFVDEEPSASFFFPREASFAAIRQRWMEESEHSGPVFFLQESSVGAALPDEGSLADILPPQKAILPLHVRRAEDKTVRLFGSDIDPVTIRVLPQETVGALKDRIKVLFKVNRNRVARLLSAGQVLDEQALPELAGSSEMELDLQLPFVACCFEPVSFEPVLYEDLDRPVLKGDVLEQLEEKKACEGVDAEEHLALPVFPKPVEMRELQVFASEPVRAMAGTGEWRATALMSGKRISGDESACALVTPEVLFSGAVTDIALERRMRIRIEEKLRGRSSSMSVWPLSKIEDLLWSPSDCVLMDGELVDLSQSLWRAGFQENSTVCVTRLMTLYAWDESGAVRKVSADLGQPLLDLRDRLGCPEEKFELWSGGQLLCGEERTLAELQIDVTGCVQAIPKGRAVTLQLGKAKPVDIGRVRSSTSFHAFLKCASEALKTELPRDTRFICVCGRVYSEECAERKDFPVTCCSAPELCLRVEKPPKAEKNQTAQRMKEASCESDTKCCEVETQTDFAVQEAAVQTDVKRMRRTVQTNVQRKRRTVQTNVQRERGTVQTDVQRERRTVQTDVQRERRTVQTDVQSERGAVQTDVQRKRRTVQTDVQRKRGTVQTNVQRERRTVQTDVQRKLGTVQTDVQRMRRTVQTNVRRQRGTVQTDVQRERRTVQTDVQKIAKFILKHPLFGSHYSSFDVPFRGSDLFGRELRAAASKALGMEPDNLRLHQTRAKRISDGRTVVRIEGGGWADESGRRAEVGEVEAEEQHRILDEEPVPFAGPLRTEIIYFLY